MKIFERSLPHAARGLTLALMVREGAAFAGSGAATMTLTAALALACARGARPRRGGRVLAVIGAVVAMRWGAMAAWLSGHLDVTTALMLVTLPVAALGAQASESADPPRPAASLAGLALGLLAPTPWIVALLLAAAWLPRRAHAPRTTPGGALAAAATLAACAGAGVTWCLTAPRFDPTPLAVLATAAGVLAARAFAGPHAAPVRWARLAGGAALLAGAAGWIVLRAETLDAPLRGAAWLAGVATGGVLVFGAVLPQRTRVVPTALPGAIGLCLAAWLAPRTDAWLPMRWRVVLAETSLAAGVPRDALDARRGDAEVVAASAGRGRSVVWRSRATDALALVEVDGSPRETDSRAGRSERFAATLAGCATQGREVARLAGDPLAETLPGLLAQGFRGVDVAAADRDLVTAVGTLDRRLGRAWLRPGVRLLERPDPLVARAGRRADAVVELLRLPWTTERGALPSHAGLRATRASLAAGGVHVLALPAGRMDAGMLAWLTRTFAEIYPRTSAWLSPEGVDTLLLLGAATPDARIRWTGIERCLESERATLAASGVSTPLDLGALAVLDDAGARAFGAPRTPGAGVPASAWQPAGVSLPPMPEVDPARVFDDEGPHAELRTRAATRRAWLAVLERTRGGDPKALFEEAARLRALPGGEAALAPLVAPHLARARTAMTRGAREGLASTAWSDAEAALATARLLTPDGAEARCVEGDLASARGQVARAETAYAACVKADPGALAGWDGLARVRRQKGDAAGMEDALRGARSARPERWTTAQNLGVYYLETGRLEDAEPLLRQASALANRETPAPVAPTLALARLHLASDRPALALAEAERALALEPGRADALAARGAARYELGQIAMAEEDFRAALAADPRDVTARGGLGQVHATRGEFDLAAAAFRTVLERDPRNAAARENLRRLGPLLQERRIPGGGRGARDMDAPP